MKTVFELDFGNGEKHKTAEIRIIGGKPDGKPYVAIYLVDKTQSQTNSTCWIEGKDLERFAVNILKKLDYKTIKK